MAETSIGSMTEDIKSSIGELASLDKYKYAFSALGQQATDLNKNFTQNRQRIIEMQQSIADAIPGVRRLGGEIKDVTSTITEIANASNRNVIANTQSIEKFYAASEVLGTSTETLVDAFTDVGYSFQRIPETLEESISYVQSIGGNAKAVMQDVVRNTDQLNRFQFADGVKGLTKMAAQAAMLRFDMNETFRLADKVLSPEGAVEMASAFQRLGVAAGNLVDPFQLMNQSINDPSGLQTSLANVSKQFTYFDEKSKSFKINPQGVMILREMEKEAGLSTGSLSKMGLAAAELDSRLSKINPKITFANEEDKQYLANIASMNEKGEYTVNIKRPDGRSEIKQLSEVTQEEMTNLIAEQKKGQRPIEEVQRDQLSLQEILTNDVKAIKDKILFGVASATPGLEVGEAARRITNAVGGALSGPGIADVKTVRGKTEDLITNIGNIITDVQNKKTVPETLKNFIESNKSFIATLGEDFTKGFDKFAKETTSKLTGNSLAERELKTLLQGYVGDFKEQGMKLKNTKAGQSLIEGTEPVKSSVTGKSAAGGLPVLQHQFPELTIKVEPSPEFKQYNKTLSDFIFTEKFNESKFKQYIIDIFKEESATTKTSTKSAIYGS